MNEKKKDFSQIKEELKKYKHCTEGQVQFAEVDSFGVVHNIQYLYWLEWARTLYFSEIGVDLNNHTYTKQFPIMVVHTEIDYLNPLYCFDKYGKQKWNVRTGDIPAHFVLLGKNKNEN